MFLEKFPFSRLTYKFKADISYRTGIIIRTSLTEEVTALLILAPSGDLMSFKLLGHSLRYQLHLTGHEVDNVLSFQVQVTSPYQVHLCILDTGHTLTYYRFHQNRWQKLHAWPGVSPAYRTLLHGEEMHVVLHTNGHNRHYILSGQQVHSSEIPGRQLRCTPYRFFLQAEDHPVLILKEIHESTTRFFARSFSVRDRQWLPEQFLASVPPDGRKLQCWLWRDVLYFSYFLPQGNSQTLYLLVLDPAQEACQEEQFPGFSSIAGEPVLTLYDSEPVLLVGEPNVLVCRRSGDRGRAWHTKIEIPCPWPLRLAPVLNHRQEITPYVAVEGVYNLSFRQPAVLKAEELLTLAPYPY